MADHRQQDEIKEAEWIADMVDAKDFPADLLMTDDTWAAATRKQLHMVKHCAHVVKPLLTCRATVSDATRACQWIATSLKEDGLDIVRALTTSGVVAELLSALTLYLDVPAVVGPGLLAIARLCTGLGRQVAVQMGAVSVAIACCNRHPCDKTVSTLGCVILFHLCRTVPGVTEVVIGFDGTRVLMRMLLQQTDDSVQQRACTLLRGLRANRSVDAWLRRPEIYSAWASQPQCAALLSDVMKE